MGHARQQPAATKAHESQAGHTDPVIADLRARAKTLALERFPRHMIDVPEIDALIEQQRRLCDEAVPVLKKHLGIRAATAIANESMGKLAAGLLEIAHIGTSSRDLRRLGSAIRSQPLAPWWLSATTHAKSDGPLAAGDRLGFGVPRDWTEDDAELVDACSVAGLRLVRDPDIAIVIARMDMSLTAFVRVIETSVGDEVARVAYRDAMYRSMLQLIEQLPETPIRQQHVQELLMIARGFEATPTFPVQPTSQGDRAAVASPLTPLTMETNRSPYAALESLFEKNIGKPLTSDLQEKFRALLRAAAGEVVLTAPVVSAEQGQPLERAAPLAPVEVQRRRDQVREMIAQKGPLGTIPRYEGRRVHGDPVAFFKTHYELYIIVGQEVLFAPDLKAVDEPLLLALRNACRNGAPLPLGTKSDLTSAVFEGRFSDGVQSIARSMLSMRQRSWRGRGTGESPESNIRKTNK